MKFNDLFGGVGLRLVKRSIVGKFLELIKQNTKKLAATALAFNQINTAILPTLMPANSTVDPLAFISRAQAQEKTEQIQVEYQLALNLNTVGSPIKLSESGFEVSTTESRQEQKTRLAKEKAAKEKAEKERQARLAAARIGVSGNCASYRSLVAKHFPASQVNNALLVMQKESGCRANAVSRPNRNGSIDRGLFQINSVHRAKVGNNVNSFLNPETNIRIAAGIYKARGNWSAWYAVCTPNKVPKFAGIHCTGRI